MNWNLFWGIYLLVFAIALILLWYFCFYKKSKYNDKCSAKTIGIVTRYSFVKYSGISLPVVKFIVDGVTYNVVGPKFKGSIITNYSSPFKNVKSEYNSNINSKFDLTDVLKIHVKTNSFVSYTKNPLLDLYPIGGQATVYYNPKNPKMAYVERFVSPSKILYTIFLIIGIILLFSSIYVLFGSTIILK